MGPGFRRDSADWRDMAELLFRDDRERGGEVVEIGIEAGAGHRGRGLVSAILRAGNLERRELDDLVGRESWTEPMKEFLQAAIACRLNLIVSGGTGAGKTTLLNILSSYQYVRVSASVLFDMRLSLYRHLQALSPRFWARSKLGDVVSRINNDIAEVQRVSADSLLSVLSNVVFLVGGAGIMIALSPRLFLVSVAAVPVSIWALQHYQRRGTNAGEPVPSPSSTLTAREREVLQLLVEGQSNKEVASSLGIGILAKLPGFNVERARKLLESLAATSPI